VQGSLLSLDMRCTYFEDRTTALCNMICSTEFIKHVAPILVIPRGACRKSRCIFSGDMRVSLAAFGLLVPAVSVPLSCFFSKDKDAAVVDEFMDLAEPAGNDKGIDIEGEGVATLFLSTSVSNRFEY